MMSVKKMIFACALIIGGSIGVVGWTIACSQKVQKGAVTNVINTISTPEEIIVFAVFIAMLLIGVLLGIKAIRTNE